MKNIISIKDTYTGDTEHIIPKLKEVTDDMQNFLWDIFDIFKDTTKVVDWFNSLDTGDTVGNFKNGFVVCDITDHLEQVASDYEENQYEIDCYA